MLVNADHAHVTLGRARRIALAAALTVVGVMVLVSVGCAAFVRPDWERVDYTSLFNTIYGITSFPLVSREVPPALVLVWTVLAYAAVAAVVYGLVVGLRRVVPVRHGKLAAFLLGWGATMVALLAAAVFFQGAIGSGYWPGLEPTDWRALFGAHANGWTLLFGWLGGLAALVAYHRTRVSDGPPAPRHTGRAFAAAALCAAVPAALMVVGGLLPLRVESGWPIWLLDFPKPLTSEFLEPALTMADVLATFAMALLTLILLTALLGLALRGARPSFPGVFVLSWICAFLVTSALGALHSWVSLIVQEGSGFSTWNGYSVFDGATYGIAIGWLAGLVAALVFAGLRRTRFPA
ncbi:hypothetical protein [Nonomuraea soli]|uniref:Uncharacterized protein n=1 Tax=Nonomuraea soli TaxID=1032476 RepID=A0A7W0CN04_9ACTN|nr:hypothetical protein [Nonomuraea soli]MBA2894029.1 hypothetical protein [Nonomuraea soli]